MPRGDYKKTKQNSIYSYRHAGKKKFAYRYRFYDQFGKRHERSKQNFSSIEDAERALIELKAAVLDNQEELVLNRNLKLRNWLTYWYENKKKQWSKSTAASKNAAIKTHLEPLLGNYPLNRLTNLTVQQLVDKMAEEGLAPTTAKRVVYVLKHALNDAVNENIIKKVPFSKLDYSKLRERPKRESLQLDRLKNILGLINSEHITHKVVLMTLLTTGIRAGELSAIRFKDVDFENRTISIDETRDYHKVEGGETKTKNSVRIITISDTLYDVYVEYKSWLFATLAQGANMINDETFFFYSSRLRPAHPTYGSYVVKTFKEKHRLESLSAHIFRHTYASVLIAEKVPVTTVAELIGDTPKTVIATYAHSLKEQEIKAVNIFDQIIKQNEE